MSNSGSVSSTGAAVESDRVDSKSTVVNVAVVRDSPADGGSTTTLVVGDIGTLRSALLGKGTLASVRHGEVEVHIGILVGVDAEVGDGEGINLSATADGGRRSLAGLGDGTRDTFVRSALALAAGTFRAGEARESESIVVLERLAGAQPGPIPARLLGAGTFVVTLAWAGEAAVHVPESRNLLDGHEGGHSAERRELHVGNEASIMDESI